MYLDENIILNPVLEDFSYIISDFELVSESSIGNNNPFKKIINLIEKLFNSFFSYMRNMLKSFNKTRQTSSNVKQGEPSSNKIISVYNWDFPNFINNLEKFLNKLNLTEFTTIMEEYRMIFSSDNVEIDKIKNMEDKIKNIQDSFEERLESNKNKSFYLNGNIYTRLSGDDLSEEKINTRINKLNNILENSRKLFNQKEEKIMSNINKMKSCSDTITRLVTENNINFSKEDRINSSISKITIIIVRIVKMELDELRTIINEVGKDIITLNKIRSI